LLKADYTLRNSDPATKAQYFQNLAKEYGIDLSNQEMPNYSPQEQFLMQQMQELRQRQDSWQNSIAQQESERAQSALSQFTQAEKPHFEAVRNDMADLMQAGKAKTLEEAYDMAVWMRPDIRSTLIEQQRAEVQRKAEEHAHALKAKAASVSVRGSSPSAGGVQPGNGSLRDVIAAQFADN
jgi:gas vesicle protein